MYSFCISTHNMGPGTLQQLNKCGAGLDPFVIIALGEGEGSSGE